MLSGTPESRHQHVRRCTGLSSRSLGLEGGGPLATSSFTIVDHGAGGAREERCTELERSAPGVGTGLQVGGAVTFEANGGYPLLEQSPGVDSSWAQLLAGPGLPAQASHLDALTGVCMHVYSQVTCSNTWALPILHVCTYDRCTFAHGWVLCFSAVL